MTTLDVSIYDFPTFAPNCFAANGVERLIVGTSSYQAATLMVLNGRKAGLIVEDLYGFIYYGLGWESRDLDNCLQLASELGGIKRIWLDCESGFSDDGVANDTEAPGVSVEYRQAKTREQRQRVESAGLQPGIYTGAFWWPSKMGNTTEFSDLPLWIANYGTNDPNNPRPPITEVNFGGWTKTAAHQYSSTIGLCGRDVRDHNYWFLEEDMAMSDQDIVAVFGSTERNPDGSLAPFEVRLVEAKRRRQEAIDSGRSVLEVAGQAQADAKTAKELAESSGGSIAPGTTFTGVIN